MKIALAQINTKVGDLKGNFDLIVQNIDAAVQKNADIVVFPELTITGYPPRDLLDFDYFVDDNLEYLEKIKNYTKNIAVICGYVEKNKESTGKNYYNAMAFIYNGEILAKYYKTLLPFYDVFDETRYFEQGKSSKYFEFKGKKIGLTICEDIWNDKDYWKRLPYSINPIDDIAKRAFDLIINISASPYWLNKEQERLNIFKNIAKKCKVPLIYVNQVGGNDDLIFDGYSLVIDGKGELKARCTNFKENMVIYDTETNTGEINETAEIEEEKLLQALIMGLKDYCRKVGFKKVILGLSGGIDSALVACLATFALGKENVVGITMPSMYSSSGSVSDSDILAQNLGIEFLNIPIVNMFNSFINTVQPKTGRLMDLAEENLQARIRSNILMNYSNRYGYLLLSTGNKSEMAVGYSTLYGDMSGGLNPISDVPKTMVYKLARYINKNQEIIPVEIIEKAPSAELRPDQKDQDSLPPYEILDDILKEFIEENKNPEEIVKKYPKEMVNFVIKNINRNEYKRRQATLGLKVTTKAFGGGRRFPIVQGYDFRLSKIK